MSRVSIDDFKKPDGNIDWTAYHEAEVQAGERCRKCRAHIFRLNLFGGEKPTGPQLCGSCKSLEEDKGHEVTHDDFVRCPYCGEIEQISDWDCDYYREKYEEGTHTVTCNNVECEKEYEIETHVSYSYTSPPMKGTDEEGT